MTREYPPPTPDEITALDIAIQRNDCDCGGTRRCSMHDQLAHDPLLRARLIAFRRDGARLAREEGSRESVAALYDDGERRQ